MRCSFTITLARSNSRTVECVALEANGATEVDTDVTALSSSTPSSSVPRSNAATKIPAGERSSSALLRRIIARRRHSAINEQLSTLTVNSAAAAERRELTKAGYDSQPATGNKMSAIRRRRQLGQLRRIHSSTYDYRHAPAATSWFPARKNLTSSTVDLNIAVTAAEGDRARPVQQRTCLGDVTCQSAATTTSCDRLPATTSEKHESTSSSPEKCFGSELDIRDYAWLMEVNRCLNPQRRSRWSDQLARVSRSRTRPSSRRSSQ